MGPDPPRGGGTVDVLKLIPQLYYDLLGRVVPGAVLLMGLRIRFDSLAIPPFSRTMASYFGLHNESAILEVSAFLLAAYVVGHLLAPLSRRVERIVARQTRDPVEQICDEEDTHLPQLSAFWRQRLCRAEYGQLSKERCDATVYLCCDWLRLHKPDAGAFATKLRAELRMHGALVAALVILLVAYATGLKGAGRQLPLVWGRVGVIAAGLVLVAARTVRTYRIFRLSVLNFCYVAEAESLIP
jgi:hypothetical protein